MPQIDFYIVQQDAKYAALKYACRIIEKAYTLGLKIHIHTEDESVTILLDDLLWTYHDGSFIPHQRKTQANELCAVTLNSDWQPAHREVLVNLSKTIPPHYEEYERVAEIIGNEPEQVQAGRERFRFYRDQGITPQHHTIN